MAAPETRTDKYIACATIVPDCPFEATATSEEELLQMVAARVALDTRRITITFDSGKAFDREQVSRLYRVARVISHVATNGRIVIEADVPRRFIERLTSTESHEDLADVH